MITYFQAIVIGVLQGISELFPVSSLGHSVLLPALFGWDGVVNSQSASESSFLAFIVGLHVATAIALIIYFRKDWSRIIRGFARTLKTRHAQTPDERLAWLLIVGTVPVGVTGLLLEHALRTLFAKPVAAAAFLVVNGLILFAGERLRRRSALMDCWRTATRRCPRLPTPRDARIPRGRRYRDLPDLRVAGGDQQVGHHDGGGTAPRS